MKTILTSWDDGCIEDLKMADLCFKYKIPAIFYIPTNCQLNDSQIFELATAFTIGGHTVSHPEDLKRLNGGRLWEEVSENKIFLEGVTGKEVKEFAYPSGRYDERVIECVKRAGYERARTTLVGYTEVNQDPYRFHTTVHVLNDRKEYKGQKWNEYALDRLAEGNYFHLFGHSWEIEKFNLWNEVEELFKKIREEYL